MAVTAGSLADSIMDIHGFLAELTELKRLEMPRDHAQKLARALSNANQHIKIPMLNSRNAALAMLAWVAVRIYFPMAKDVMTELGQQQAPHMAAAAAAGQPGSQAEPMRSGSGSGSPVSMDPHAMTLPGNIVPASNDEETLQEWLPTLN